MSPCIHLTNDMRESLKNAISFYVDSYITRIAPVFANVEEEASEKASLYFKKAVNAGISFDYGEEYEISEQAREHGYEYWEATTLFQYNTKMMTIATLYQFWEQQIRKFAFNELSSSQRLPSLKVQINEFATFCTKFAEIESLLQQCGVALASLGKIIELHLLQNVIKHGDGPSAKKLELIRPDYFRKINDTHLMDLYLTTLNERVLDVDDSEIINFRDAIKMFWDELPEKMYFKP